MLHFKYVACCFAFLPLLLHGVTAGAARQALPSWHNINNSTAYEVRLHFKTPPAGWANHVIYGMQSMTADIVNRDLDSIKAKASRLSYWSQAITCLIRISAKAISRW